MAELEEVGLERNVGFRFVRFWTYCALLHNLKNRNLKDPETIKLAKEISFKILGACAYHGFI